MNQPYATLTLASPLREMFGVQLYKNNARALLLRILSILNLDWLQHARSVRGVYELATINSWEVHNLNMSHTSSEIDCYQVSNTRDKPLHLLISSIRIPQVGKPIHCLIYSGNVLVQILLTQMLDDTTWFHVIAYILWAYW